jgi:hypothetical protein
MDKLNFYGGDKMINRDNLIDAYINATIDDMDTLTLQEMVADMLYNTLKEYTTSELRKEVKTYHPELLKEHTK